MRSERVLVAGEMEEDGSVILAALINRKSTDSHSPLMSMLALSSMMFHVSSTLVPYGEMGSKGNCQDVRGSQFNEESNGSLLQ